MKRWKRESVYSDKVCDGGDATASTQDACAPRPCTLHLPYVSPASRMQRLRAPARVVAVAESLSLVPETAACDRRSHRGRSHADPRKRGDAREIALALSRSAPAAP